MAFPPPSRHRAPFAHQSSSLDVPTAPLPPPHYRSAIAPAPSFPDPALLPTGACPLDSPPSRRFSLPYLTSNSKSLLAALPAVATPSTATIRFISLCFLWYACSAISNNTGKVILNRFKYPVTLTLVQFFFVALCCAICSHKTIGWAGRLRRPTKAIMRGTLPLAVFQVGGHIFGSMAISRVPVSTVHTIKALSPLFTVMAYSLLFGVSYSPSTYLSLLPLTLGVMLACSFDISFSNFLGLICALGSTLVFVSQNIFFKKIMPTSSSGASESGGASAKLDKINLLYFSSGMAFILMFPLWVYSDARSLFNLWSAPAVQKNETSVLVYFFFNGTVHFAQSIIAFALLSSTSPVTYSIASLVKRIAVICLAIIWFKQPVHSVQAMGIIMTGIGLWMYNSAKRDVDRGEKKMRHVEAVRGGMLPTTIGDQRILEEQDSESDFKGTHNSPRPVYNNSYNINLPSSTTTAMKSSFSQSPFPAAHTNAPYPSPPASTTSSPPSDPAMLHHSRNRQRRLSAEGEKFRLPPSVNVRSPGIEEGNEFERVNRGIAVGT
ncbi:solute carrier family 35, member E1 [Cryptococcus wingfieldii CBS 7118]|uniref:Solute carrier family 35, member E1 n=1 Tax=Cryptococcus wingfieldii CBS 7118 TaxID=1295528 RepID=A0A1E3J6H3_9TREE|nr:solute carrier family 35, member E1 [Cryptococcus wingfieldii CBS 7118]ODN95696.1 solute carrier family 35, member E1 [Cryptococcus wingfieldii CBS 7118]